MRKARSRLATTRLARSSLAVRASQRKQPRVGAGGALIYAIRQGAHRRSTSGRASLGVDQFAQPLADLEEGYALLGHRDGRTRLGIAPLARVAPPDAEAAEP